MAIVLDTTTIPGVVIVNDDANGGVAIDYSTQLNTLAEKVVEITTTTLESIDIHLSTIASFLDRLKELEDPDTDGPGVRVTDPYHNITLALIYNSLIEEATILENASSDPAQKALAVEKVKELIGKFYNDFSDIRNG